MKNWFSIVLCDIFNKHTLGYPETFLYALPKEKDSYSLDIDKPMIVTLKHKCKWCEHTKEEDYLPVVKKADLKQLLMLATQVNHFKQNKKE